MKIISHRGNLAGAEPHTENKLETIDLAIRHGFDVEIDVWSIDGKLFLGHDEPEHSVSPEFLQGRAEYLWVHAKNFEAVGALAQLGDLNYFWHDTDKYTLTSQGYVWAYPGNPGNAQTVGVDINLEFVELYKDCYGICTDKPLELLKMVGEND
nr:hypothetical protein 3 [bacterium]